MSTFSIKLKFMEIQEKHSLQRPPFSVSTFGDEDILKIKDFLYKEFFVVCSLYEYALRPRVELVLKCEPHVPELPPLTPLYKMKKVEDPTELPVLKQYHGGEKEPTPEGEGDAQQHETGKIAS